MTRLGKFLWDSNVMKHFLSFLVQFITFSQNYSRNFHFVIMLTKLHVRIRIILPFHIVDKVLTVSKLNINPLHFPLQVFSLWFSSIKLFNFNYVEN